MAANFWPCCSAGLRWCSHVIRRPVQAESCRWSAASSRHFRKVGTLDAQAIGGERTSRGLIPAAIKDAVELRLLGARPGSLSLELVPVRKEMQQPLFEDSEESLLEVTVERFLGLMSGRSDLLQDAADLGPRATSHIAELSKCLAEAQATASMTWESRRASVDSLGRRGACRRAPSRPEGSQYIDRHDPSKGAPRRGQPGSWDVRAQG